MYSLPNEPHLTEFPAKWNKWQDIEGRLVKHEESGSVANLHSSIESIALKFFFVKSANPDSDTAVLQMDFAENLTCVAWDQVQSAHWNQARVTYPSTTVSSATAYGWV